MKVLIFGPSGSGKTFISNTLKNSGVNAFDDGDIKDLSAWYDKNGNKVAEPKTANEALGNYYSFIWSKRILAEFLNKYSDVYIFGGSGNIFTMFDLFDKIYFLKVEPQIQKERILNSSQRNSQMDINEDGLVIWGGWLEEAAKKDNVPFIDASLTPKQIFAIIQGN
jgi:adenylate kinase family enzyme